MSSSELSPPPPEFVSRIDPKLTYVRNLRGAEYPSSLIYQVRRGRKSFVLKAVSEAEEDSLLMLYAERDCLITAADVVGITHFVQDYGLVDGYGALLKEFAKGDPWDEIASELRFSSDLLRERYTSQLVEIVTSLHTHGICGLDLNATNIVASPNREKITLIDFYLDGFSYCREAEERDFAAAWRFFC